MIKGAAQNALSDMLRCEDLLSRSSALSECELLWERDQVGKVLEAWLRNTADADLYAMFLWKIYGDIERLKVSGEHENQIRFEWRQKQPRFEDGGVERNEYHEQCRKKAGERFLERFLWFGAGSWRSAADIGG